ncbi:hypothetical protein HDU83_008799 [Entophlyctis luteolus]|nr:hypothetical protein HDU83_008799 [Entophlyctis luteolus]
MSLVLGIDLSTQSISAVVADAGSYKITATASVKLDSLGFGTTNGVLHRSHNEVVAPSLMFCAALDALLGTLVAQKVPLDKVAAVSGCGQQHGSVFWANGAEAVLLRLDPKLTLKEQLKDAFAIEAGPIWMDSSTTSWCERLEAHVGGAQALADLTGSRAYERFTANQIAKIAETRTAEFATCERIGLISSMLTTLLTGRHQGIEASDASGMNALDIRTRKWAPSVLEFIAACAGGRSAADIAGLLGEPAVSYAPVGVVSAYFVQRYGINAECQVIPFTGDNPSTLAGLGISAPGDLAVSLGTSDTAFAVVDAKDCKPNGAEGHVLVNPVDPNTFIVMLCFKNGSLAREKLKDEICSSKTWDEFNSLLSQTPVGNNGAIGFFHPEPEITPPTSIPGIHIFRNAGAKAETDTSQFSAATLARAILESQMLRLRHHAGAFGLTRTQTRRVLVSGGASANIEIVRVIGSVFGARVCKVADADGAGNAAGYGGALRAAHGLACAAAANSTGFVAYEPGVAVESVAEPETKDTEVYDAMMATFGELEAKAQALTK